MDSLNSAFDRAGSIFNRKPQPTGAKNFSGVPFLPSKGDPWPQSSADKFLPITSASQFIDVDTNSLYKTDLSSGKISLNQLSYTTRSGFDKYKFGFTPVSYFKPNNEVEFNTNPEYTIPSSSDISSTNFKDKKNKKAFIDYENLSYYKLGNNSNRSKNSQGEFLYSLSDRMNIKDNKTIYESNDGSGVNGENDKSRLSSYTGTLHDNEDPVYFAFELVLNIDNSPLLNGQVEEFLNSYAYSGDGTEFESNKRADEFRSRNLGHISIINQFKRELLRWFKMNRTFTSTELRDDSHMFHEPIERRYYLKGIKGLDKLIERNTSSAEASFVDYGKDLITLTFNEDVTLNMGTLASLYKELYWSRLRGKGIVPENLLRFDCKLIVSEMRNFVRVVNQINTGDVGHEVRTDNSTFKDGKQTLDNYEGTLTMIRDNLTRYVYDLYECQFFFDKMSHPTDISMNAPVMTDSYDVSFSFKYSNMTFERFDHPNAKWKKLANKFGNPLEVNSETFPEATEFGNRYGYNLEPDLLTTFGDKNNDGSKTKDPISNYVPSEKNTELPDQLDAAEDARPFPKKSKSIYEKAGEKLLKNLKTAALNEAQRQINDKFKLINSSLDKIRNSFGIGRMKDPTNVYSQPYGKAYSFFFDVKNSLRDFGGDTLGGIIK